MNIRSYAILALLGGITLVTSACEVDHEAGKTQVQVTTTAAPTTTTSTTTATPDLHGNYCWTEINDNSPEGVEGICGDADRVDQQLDKTVFLHWGLPKVEDYRTPVTPGQTSRTLAPLTVVDPGPLPAPRG